MTDKQIIIDGIDVGGCSCYVSTGECTNKNIYPDRCSVYSNCTYKLEQQLKRKEQECERLNADNIYLRDRVGKLERAILRRNEELDQLKQAIEKIKELIQKEINDCEHCDDCESCEYNCCTRQILQICDEVKE